MWGTICDYAVLSLCLSSTECAGFTVEGSTQGSWNDTKPGDTVTITCEKNFVLVGTSELTCTSDVVWSSDPPNCIDMTGKLKSTDAHHGPPTRNR